jgi:hypothetical protein
MAIDHLSPDAKAQTKKAKAEESQDTRQAKEQSTGLESHHSDQSTGQEKALHR